MKLNRNFVTPFVACVFIVVALSGILMFFHLFDGYTEVMHECLGIVFSVFAIMHIIINWKGLSSHFRKGVFITAGIVVATVSLGFVTLEKMFPPIDIVVMQKLVKAPISDSFKFLEIDYKEASEALGSHGIKIDNAKTIEDIWIKNKTAPEEVLEILISK